MWAGKLYYVFDTSFCIVCKLFLSTKSPKTFPILFSLYAGHPNFETILISVFFFHFSISLVALLSLSSWCLVIVVLLFLVVPWACLQFVIVVFPDHTHYFSICMGHLVFYSK